MRKKNIAWNIIGEKSDAREVSHRKHGKHRKDAWRAMRPQKKICDVCGICVRKECSGGYFVHRSIWQVCCLVCVS